MKEEKRFHAMMATFTAHHDQHLEEAKKWVRSADVETVAQIRVIIDANKDEAIKSGDVAAEICCRLARLGFEYCHIAAYEQDRDGQDADDE